MESGEDGTEAVPGLDKAGFDHTDPEAALVRGPLSLEVIWETA